MPLPLLLAGAAIQGVGALMQNSKGNQQARQAAGLRQQRDSAFNAIPLEDPRQVQILEEVRRRRRSFESGTAFESQLRNLRSAQTGTQQNILRASGGSGGAAIAGLSRTQLATGRAISDLGKVSMQAQLQLTDMIGQQSNLISKRKDQLQLLRFSQLSAETAQMEKDANLNKNAAVASMVGIGGSLLAGALGGIKPKTPSVLTPPLTTSMNQITPQQEFVNPVGESVLKEVDLGDASGGNFNVNQEDFFARQTKQPLQYTIEQ